MTYSIIQKSKLEGAGRLDAEYYQPEYLEVAEKLNSSLLLEDVAKKITDFGAYSQMNFVEYIDSGVRFLRNHDVGDMFINDSDPIFVSGKVYKKLSLKLEKNDIITPRVGTLGNAAVILDDNIPATANQNLAQIKPDLKKINPFYLVAFLCSCYGRKQFERSATGNVQPWLNLQQIQSLKVFIPKTEFQNKIEDFVLDSLKELKNSKSLYQQAEDLLLVELGLSESKTWENDELSNVVNFSDVKDADRIDAEYFQVKYIEILEKIENYKNGNDLVKNIINFKDKNYNPENEKKYKYLALANISNQGYVQDYQEELGKDLPTRARRIINTDDVVISSIEGSSSSCALIEKEFDNSLCSTGFFVINSEKINSETLLIMFKTDFFQELLRRGSKGAILSAISKTELENIKIPILPKSTQQKIADLVKKSHEARKQAKELLEQAKQKVEILIEGL